MAFAENYCAAEPARRTVDAHPGDLVLEFGAPWCGYCRGAQAHIAQALADQSALVHWKIEDGPGRPLGRSFRIKLWPTLVLLRDGVEVARVVRPADAGVIRQAFGWLPAQT